MSPILGIVSSSRRGAPAGAYESIATVTASGGETSLNFTSIPSTYKSLQIRGFFLGSGGGSMRVNSDSSANYARHYLGGNGASTYAGGQSSQSLMFTADDSGATYNSVQLIDIVDYADTSKYKTVRAINGYQTNTITGSLYMYSGLWMSTSAISSIQLGCGNFNGSFNAGTTYALYGIKGA